MRAYLGLLSEILHTGEKRQDRTGVGTYGLFGKQLRLSLKGGVWPCLTTKKVHVPSVVHELLWFLSGDTNVQYLQKNGVRIWNAWADPKTGDLGPIYGAQWRRWSCDNGKTIDQISQLIEGLKKDPFSRRHLVVAYNPGQVDQMALPPCHAFFQFYVSRGAGKGPLELSCQLYQRSADIFLGVPFKKLTHVYKFFHFKVFNSLKVEVVKTAQALVALPHQAQTHKSITATAHAIILTLKPTKRAKL